VVGGDERDLGCLLAWLGGQPLVGVDQRLVEDHGERRAELLP
jgi:hypothetical protein